MDLLLTVRFKLSELRMIVPTDTIYIVQKSTIVFEVVDDYFQDRLRLEPSFFWLKFDQSPFLSREYEFNKRLTARGARSEQIAQEVVSESGEFKFSVGFSSERGRSRDFEVDPYLIVLPNRPLSLYA